MGWAHFLWLVGLAFFLGGCANTNYTVVIEEEEGQCSIIFQGKELVTNMVHTDGCIKWKSDKCEIEAGTLCRK